MYPDERYGLYKSLHHSFSESYVKTGKQVMDFYPAWKNFMDTQGPEISRLVNAFSAAESGEHMNNGFEMLFYFLKDFKEDASAAHNIMNDYTTLCTQSNTYMKKVFMLQEKNQDAPTGQVYEQLIPELNSLISGFKDVEQKTHDAMMNLQVIQAEWMKIREHIIAP